MDVKMSTKDVENKTRISFIEEHRRRQIIDTAIRIIARDGLNQASLANIAQEAGISKGVISYYFNSKDDLIDQIVISIMEEMKDYIRERVERLDPAPEKLRRYVSSFFEFAQSNSEKYSAFIELWTTISTKDMVNPFGSLSYEQCRAYIGKILNDGKKSGEFGSVDIKLTATVLQGLVDGVIIQWLLDPELVDLEACQAKVLELIDLYMKHFRK
jgi:TetR/AcrR family fatty acid metabolism transcriptional regulator